MLNQLRYFQSVVRHGNRDTLYEMLWSKRYCTCTVRAVSRTGRQANDLCRNAQYL